MRFFLLIFILGLTSCNDSAPEQQLEQHAQAIEHGDVCYLCGMTIDNFPGPKGELYERGHNDILKFGSTRDLFAYLLDPEHHHAIQSVFVHDMGITSWDHPESKAFINARTAWYVVGSNRKGAMGPTLASFSDKKLAIEFAKKHGGKIYTYDDVNEHLLLGIK